MASRSFAPGDIIARLPLNTTLVTGAGSLPEEARKLLIRIHTDPKVNETLSAFFSSMPGMADMLAPASLAPAELAELQMPELVSSVASLVPAAG